MIDVSQCKLEDSYCDGEFDCIVHYFTYPKELGEQEYRSRFDYGNVVSTCISLSQYSNGYCDLQISPTVQNGTSLSDVDWFDLEEGVGYTAETVTALLKMAKKNQTNLS